MLRKIRVFLAITVFVLCTLLFLDFTGRVTGFAGWLAKIQFLPALLAVNVGVLAILIVLTLIFGRVYCSIICPMGIFQDGISWMSGRRKGKSTRFRWSPEKKWLRYSILVIFIAALLAGINVLYAVLAPYSSYGRMVQSLLGPIWDAGNNLLALIAEKTGSVAFAHKEFRIFSLPTILVSIATLLLVFILAWKNGRTYCNTICPVGTILSFFSRFSLFRPVIDSSKCKNCHLCERKCKASCINLEKHEIDYSRCVDCFDCLDSCKFGALEYKLAIGNKKQTSESKPVETSSSGDGMGRRTFLATAAVATTAAMAEAAEKKVDGVLAEIVDKKIPERKICPVPFGAESIKHLHQHCTACQLCISQCPNDVLRPSSSLTSLMQPTMSFERGWCRPECTKCSEVCPNEAIREITPEEKTAIHIGKAVVNLELCVVNTDGVSCGNCARHCPAGAIKMVRKEPDNKDSLRIPTVNEVTCIGCGACEYLCPSRPYSAIHVEGLAIHRNDQ